MFSKKSRGAKVGRRPRQNVDKKEMVLYRPPTLPDYEVVFSQRLRFTAVAATAVGGTLFSWTDLSDTVVVAISAVAGIKLFPFVKIKLVEIWDDAAQGTPETICFTWSETDANQSSPPRTITDTSIGVTPAHIKVRPPRDSLSSKWHGVSGNNCFNIECGVGAIIDVHLSMKNSGFVTSAIACQNALVGATAGQVYFRGLDGVALATTNFLPPRGVLRI